MFDDNHPDLNLAETAPMHLDDDVFDGLLDYAVSADAHDVDDSIVPADSPADAVADDDLDSIALADDADDPLDFPADDSPVTADDSPATAGNGHGDLDDFAGDLPDELPGDLIDDPTAAAHADDFDGFGAGTVDDGVADPSSSIDEADPEMEW